MDQAKDTISKRCGIYRSIVFRGCTDGYISSAKDEPKCCWDKSLNLLRDLKKRGWTCDRLVW